MPLPDCNSPTFTDESPDVYIVQAGSGCIPEYALDYGPEVELLSELLAVLLSEKSETLYQEY